MKRIITFLLIAATFTVGRLQAQEQTFTQAIDSVFQFVSKVDATTGILYNRVLPFSGLYRFSQADTANSEIFMQAYTELYEAAFLPQARLPFDVGSLENQISQQQYLVDVGILHYKYNVLNDSMIWQKLYFDYDSVIRENTNITASLYAEQTAFIVSPLRDNINGLSVTYNFVNLFCFDNTANPIISMQADFDNGNGLQTVGLSTNVTVNYINGGTHTLKFIAILQSRDTLTTYSQIEIIDTNQLRAITGQKIDWKWMRYYDGKNVVNPGDTPNPPIKAKINIPVYESSSGLNEGNVWIYYAHADKKLRKPILLVDGFDPGNKRQFESHEKENEKDAELLRYYSIWKLLEYEENSDPVNFGKQLLEDYGYDLVVLDLPDGGGYIERNAMVCIEVINRINGWLSESGSKHEIVVVGPSMGGQISRFALAYMENPDNHNANTNYGKHNCRLWVSFDSPHQGANISIGAQHVIKLFAEKEEWTKTLCCKAAKQMLLHHADPTGVTYYAKWTAARKAAYPTTNGYPVNLRKIAVSNGSFNNTSNGVAGGKAFDASIWWTALVSPLWGPIFGFGAPPIAAQIIVHHTTDAGNGEVMNVRLWYGPIPISFKKEFFNNNTGKCSADACPGGSYNTFDQLRSKLKKYGATVQTNKNVHCFMPVPSTLDINGNLDYCTNFSTTDLVATKKIPFASYAGSSSDNMYHVKFDKVLVDWLTNEIETYIEPKGKRELFMCGGDTAHYSVHFPVGKTSTVHWEHSSNLQIVSGQDTKTIIVKPIGFGKGWVEATLKQNGILTHNKTLKKYEINVVFSEPVTIAPTLINNNRVWGSPMLALQDITIMPTCTLAVSSTLYMSPGVKIIVNPGGTLVVHGGTITNACPNKMWEGVVVQGNPNQPMTKFYQGFLQMNPNGKIENAICGVTVNGGGIIEATDAHFINNTRAVKFMPLAFGQSGTSGKFTNVKFVLDNNYMAVPQEHKGHLNMERCGEVLVTDCEFSILFSTNSDKGIVALSTSTKWSGNNKLISIPVTIQSGATFNTTGTIKSNDKTTILIEPLGKLVIDGGTFTNYSSGTMWKGIIIMGDATKPISKTYQGVVELKNNGKIENAEIGITLINGGMAETTNAKFINNTTAVLINPINPIQIGRSGTFTLTDFITNNSYIGDISKFESHISMKNCGSVILYGCNFSSTAPQTSSSCNIGIRVINSPLTVKDYCSGVIPIGGQCPNSVPSTFTGFYNGIRAANSGTSPIFKVSYSNFDNNLYGIDINKINNFELIRNYIKSTQNNSFGVYVYKSTGYKIEENKFWGVSPKTTTGLKIENSGIEENEVYKNEFHNLNIGQHFLSKNSSQKDTFLVYHDTIVLKRGSVTGLQTICNEFYGSLSRDILVGNPNSSYLNSSIRKEQGSSQKPAGNRFSQTLPANLPHFESKSQHPIDYFHGTNSIEIPRTLGRFNLIPADTTNSCSSKIGIMIAKEQRLARYNEYDEEYQYWLNRLLEFEGDNIEEYNLLLGMVSYFSQLKDNYFNSIIVDEFEDGTDAIIEEEEIFEEDEDGGSRQIEETFPDGRGCINENSNFENLRFLYAYRSNYTDNLCIAETYMAENKFGESLDAISQIFEKFVLSEEQVKELRSLQVYIHWLIRLNENDLSIYSLPENEIDYLVNYVYINSGCGQVFAKNILCELYNICIEEDETLNYAPPVPKNPTENEEESIESSIDNTLQVKNKLLFDNISIIPNPTKGELRVELGELIVEKIEIFDIVGRIVSSHHLHTPSSHHTIDISHLNSGNYFVKLTSKQGNFVKKVLKQ